MKKYILGREQYGECNTLLPELAATEVVKCVQYMRMDIEIFEELLSMVAPVIQRKSTKFIYTIIFSVDQLSGRQPGLGLAGGGGAQTPKCNSPQWIGIEGEFNTHHGLQPPKFTTLATFLPVTRRISTVKFISSFVKVREKYCWSGRVVYKFHYIDLQTLSTTRSDPQTKSVHFETERTSIQPDKVRGHVGHPSRPDLAKSGWVALVEISR